jgi:DNA-binding CsgD family transcriptional regulator
LLSVTTIEPHPTSDEFDPQGRRRRLFEAIYQFVRGQAAQFRALILEDMHWSDQASQEALRYLARAIDHDPILIIGTYRTDELHRRHPLSHLLAQLTRERHYHEVRLAPLTRAESETMLERTLGRSLPAPVVDTLFNRTEGNPFFAEELLKALIERNRLDTLIESGQHARAIDQIDIPRSIKDSIIRRTAHLDPLAITALNYAAVIGRHFDFELLQMLVRASEADLINTLTQLIDRQLIIEDVHHCEDRYSFRHELTREAIYSDMLGREQRIRHREVLLAMEQHYRSCLDEMVDQLAHHSIQARDLTKAAHYAKLAGDRAARVSAYGEAVAHYEAALDSIDDEPAQRADLLDRLGEAAFLAGHMNRCTRALREAKELYEQLGDSHRAGDVTRRLGRAAWVNGDAETAFALNKAAIQALERDPPSRELAMAYSALSQLHMVSSQPAESITLGEQALAMAEAFGDESVRAHALNNLGSSLIALGEVQRGLAYLEESLEIAKRANLIYDALRAYNNLGGELSLAGYYTRAAELLQEGVTFVEQVGWDLHLGLMHTHLGHVELMLGNWDDAEALIRQTGYRKIRFKGTLIRAELLLGRGELDKARRLIEAALPDYEASEWITWLWLILARIAFIQDDLPQACELMDRSLAASPPDEHACLSGKEMLPYAVEVYLKAAQHAKVQELCHVIARKAARTGVPAWQAMHASVQGLCAAHADRHTEAAEHFRQAAQFWSEMLVPFEEALARRRRAASLVQLGDEAARNEARQELAAARTVFERLGATLELEDINTLARQHGLIRRGRPANRDGLLTARERQVIAYIAQGYSNRAIAETLVISEKTVEIHVGNILGKLGFTSRAQAAAYAVEQGLAEAPAAA